MPNPPPHTSTHKSDLAPTSDSDDSDEPTIMKEKIVEIMNPRKPPNDLNLHEDQHVKKTERIENSPDQTSQTTPPDHINVPKPHQEIVITSPITSNVQNEDLHHENVKNVDLNQNKKKKVIALNDNDD